MRRSEDDVGREDSERGRGRGRDVGVVKRKDAKEMRRRAEALNVVTNRVRLRES